MEKLHNISAPGIVFSKYVLLLLLLLLIAAQADAQYGSPTNQVSLGIGPQIGLYKAQDADNMKVMGGVAVRLKLAQAIGVEGSINYRQEEYDNGAIKVKSWPVMATGLLYVLPVVYGAIGAGWYNTTIDYNIPSTPLTPTLNVTSETKQRFGWHFGGGVELPLGTVAKLTGDIRYVFLDYKFQQIPGTGDLKSNFYVIGVGLLFGLQ
jgi:opacity protein-like surface antigen